MLEIFHAGHKITNSFIMVMMILEAEMNDDNDADNDDNDDDFFSQRLSYHSLYWSNQQR